MGYVVTGSTQGGWARKSEVETLQEAELLAADMCSGYDERCSDSRVKIYKAPKTDDSEPIRQWRGSPEGWYETV